ncbi:MAG: hypothetical protein AABX36_04885 [Candidatus Thermoplasmatota archaeon]
MMREGADLRLVVEDPAVSEGIVEDYGERAPPLDHLVYRAKGRARLRPPPLGLRVADEEPKNIAEPS